MLETIREYGLERLEESGEAQALHARHARFFLELTERAALALGGPNQVAWASRLESDHDNLRAALAWACDQGDTNAGLRFAAGLWRFWSARGHGHEAKRWVERMLELPVADAETRIDRSPGSNRKSARQYSRWSTARWTKRERESPSA